MRRFILPLVLLTFTASIFLVSLMSSSAVAETKVHRKTVQHDVDLYVTSW